MFRKNGAFIVAAACVFAFGVYLVVPSFHKQVNTTEQIQSQGVSYQGQDGKTALDLLKDKYDVETTKFDFGEMVTGISGVKSNSNQFWAFYVNGQLATQSASSFITKTSDTISWKLENIQ